MKEQIIVLLSGGIDSATTCLYLSKIGYDVLPLFIDYGQNARASEWTACKKISNLLGLKPKKININTFNDGLNFLLLNKKYKATKHYPYELKLAFMPQRNLLLATIGAIYASEVRVNKIGIGIIGKGSFTYPDTTARFLQKLNSILKMSAKITVLAPFVNKNKLDVILYGLKHNFRYDKTFSCNLNSHMHCGRCANCFERHVLFNKIGIVDTTQYLKKPKW